MSEINPLLREEPIPDDNDRALRPKSLGEFVGQGCGQDLHMET